MAKLITPANPLSTIMIDNVKQEIIILELEGITVEDGLSRTQGNTKLYTKLLRIFKSSHKDFISEFRTTLNTKQWIVAQRLAHTIKETAGNIGTKNLQKACLELEIASKNKSVTPANILVAENELDIVIGTITKFKESASFKKDQILYFFVNSFISSSFEVQTIT